MLRCAICQKPLRECCDLFHEAIDEQGNDVVICYECAEKHQLPFEDEVQQDEANKPEEERQPEKQPDK